jgi:hypothetical protein
MLKLFRSLVTPAAGAPAVPEEEATPLPERLRSPGVPDFDIPASLAEANGLPLLDWDAAHAWVEAIPAEARRAEAWSACERAWLQHLGAALGGRYRLRGAGSALLLSSLEGHVAEATLAFVNKTVQRILRVLDGVAESHPWGHDILIVFDDEDTYYRYVSHYYAEGGEFAASGGMYLHHGCGHFVTVKADLQAIEPVIAHELTHACLSHLSIPAWLNEGLAVNTEQRLCPTRLPDAREMQRRHRSFWGPQEVQQFWSGKSFLRPDEGNELSYDLARILVAQFAADWDRFRPFALAARFEDAGEAAAREHLGLGLGELVAALLEEEPAAHWSPDPAAWHDTPERGGFRGMEAHRR